METRANYIAVGIFTLLTIIAAFGFIYWTAGYGEQGETVRLRVRIPGSASGLSRGSAVLFNGVKVGDVRRVFIDVNNPEVAVADTVVDRLTPITKSTKADIGLAGLTGTANIELKGASTAEPNLLDEAERNGTVAVITANPSAVTNLLQTAQTILTRADKVVSQLEGFVGDARQPLTDTVNNVQAFSEALSRNAKGIDTFLENVASLSDTLKGVSGQLNGTLKSAQDILSAVDRDKVAQIVDNVDNFSQALSRNGDNIDKIVADVQNLSTRLNGVSDKLDTTLTSANDLIGAVDKEKIAAIVANVDNFSQSLSRNSDAIDTLVSNVNGLTTKIAGVSDRLDTTLNSADQLIKSVDREKVSTIVADVQTFVANAKQATSGLDEIMAGVDDAVKSINSLSDNANTMVTKANGVLEGVDPATVRTAHGEFRAGEHDGQQSRQRHREGHLEGGRQVGRHRQLHSERHPALGAAEQGFGAHRWSAGESGQPAGVQGHQEPDHRCQRDAAEVPRRRREARRPHGHHYGRPRALLRPGAPRCRGAHSRCPPGGEPYRGSRQLHRAQSTASADGRRRGGAPVRRSDAALTLCLCRPKTERFGG